METTFQKSRQPRLPTSPPSLLATSRHCLLNRDQRDCQFPCYVLGTVMWFLSDELEGTVKESGRYFLDIQLFLCEFSLVFKG